MLLTGEPIAAAGIDMMAPIDDRRIRSVLGTGGLLGRAKAWGYRSVVIGSGYEHVGLRAGVEYIDVGPRNEFEQTIVDQTPVLRWMDGQLNGRLQSLRDRTLGEYAAADALIEADSPTPILAFIHIPAPHGPFALRADCDLRTSDRYSLGSYARDNHAGDEGSLAATAGQTECVDRLMANSILKLSARRPDAVCIVLSDHGPDERLDWWSPAEPGLGDRMANLFWAYTRAAKNSSPTTSRS